MIFRDRAETCARPTRPEGDRHRPVRADAGARARPPPTGAHQPSHTSKPPVLVCHVYGVLPALYQYRHRHPGTGTGNWHPGTGTGNRHIFGSRHARFTGTKHSTT